ncbi:MAG: beta-ketoacyl-[acyl-carrier-protein] synthase family protein [Myxococcota bacterium]
MGTRRVVVTGMGLRSPLGDTPAAMFDAVVADRTGIVHQPQWAEIAELGACLGAPVSGFDEQVIPRKYRRTMGRVAQLAVASAIDAVAAAGLTRDQVATGRTAVVTGSTVGSPAAEEVFWEHLLRAKSARGIRSTLFFHGMSHTCAANVALMLGVTGEVLSTNSACASSAQAIGVAADRIRAGRADIALAGGAEELHVASAVVFQALGAVSAGTDPSTTPRPFDRTRDGIVVGEGGGIVVLEERDHALARGAPILAEVLGFGTSCDAENMANPAPEGMIAAIRACLGDAGPRVRSEHGGVDYVNAHATGTRAGDAAEALALLATVGPGVPVSSSKGHFGHLLGACSVVEAIVCVEAMRTGIAPGTRNLVDPDAGELRVLREAIRTPIRRALSTSFAFGGVNAVLLFGDEATARS